MSEPIDIFGGLKIDRREGRAGKPGSARVVCEFTAPSLVWHADEKAIAGEVAEAMQLTIQENLLRGLAPDGTPLPSPAAATLERREYRLDQATRGGQASDQVTDKRERSTIARNWRRRFKAARLGMQSPRAGARSFGLESGLLAMSVKAVAEAGVWKVYFAVIRAKLDDSGSSAVLRVFKRIGMWNAAAARQPRVQEALRSAQKKLFASSAAKALAAARESLASVMALSEELDEDG